jgi:hypothetical protein
LTGDPFPRIILELGNTTENAMRSIQLTVDQIVDILANTDSYLLEMMVERLVEVDPGTAYVLQCKLTELEKEMA